MAHIEHQLTALFREAGAAHHRAFASTNGEDADWPGWYAGYLVPRLEELTGRTFDPPTLADELKDMDAQHMDGGEGPWPEFYARAFLQRHPL